MSKIKTIVLTSKENFVWTSMTEIVPSLELAWKESCNEQHCVEIVNVDGLELKELLPKLLSGNNFVFTVFTTKLAKLGEMLRSKFSIDGRYIIHLHNMATIGCWPMHHWGWGSVLRKSDIFISTCKNDILAMGNCFIEPEVRLIPFYLMELETGAEENTSTSRVEGSHFVYIGRLSVQKNIHGLIYGLFRLSQKFPDLDYSLDLFGETDNLGCPHLEYKFENYELFLKELVGKLGLLEKVNFRGYVNRDKIESELNDSPYIFLSPSMHSDENFGIAALRSLRQGALAVLSDWGGHHDYPEHFPEKVFTAKIQEGNDGPFLDIEDWVKKLQQAIVQSTNESKKSFPDYYSKRSVVEKFRAILNEPVKEQDPLEMTDLARDILGERNRYKGEGSIGNRIFSSFSDPLWKPFLQSYGMGPTIINCGKLMALVPWSSIADNEITVSDPHKGIRHFAYSEGPTVLKNHLGNCYNIDSETAAQLASHGYGSYI
ncbi:MAG: glycosyltransferase [Halobacteriovoraceae bacterium]|nr:glycosyltransferase [Halobacteriovoraceae bacterium]